MSKFQHQNFDVNAGSIICPKFELNPSNCEFDQTFDLWWPCNDLRLDMQFIIALFAESLSPSFNSIGALWNLTWPLTCDDLHLNTDIHNCPPWWSILTSKFWCWKSAEKNVRIFGRWNFMSNQRRNSTHQIDVDISTVFNWSRKSVENMLKNWCWNSDIKISILMQNRSLAPSSSSIGAIVKLFKPLTCDDPVMTSVLTCNSLSPRLENHFPQVSTQSKQFEIWPLLWPVMISVSRHGYS